MAGEMQRDVDGFERAFVKNFLSSSVLGNTLGGFGGKVGNSWVLGGTIDGGSGLLKSESGG